MFSPSSILSFSFLYILLSLLLSSLVHLICLVLTPADDENHVQKHDFNVPFVCGARNLGEALRRISEGAAMIRTKGEAGTGVCVCVCICVCCMDIVSASTHFHVL